MISVCAIFYCCILLFFLYVVYLFHLYLNARIFLNYSLYINDVYIKEQHKIFKVFHFILTISQVPVYFGTSNIEIEIPTLFLFKQCQYDIYVCK